MKKIVLLTFGVFLSVTAKAAVITSDFTELLTTGQSYNETVAINQSFENVFLDLVIKGDFDSPNSEWFRMFLDGTQILNWSTATPNVTVVTNSSTRDYTISGLVPISQALWDSITADGSIDISWAIGPFSDPTPSANGIDFVSYSLNGALASSINATAAAPSTLLLFGALLLVSARSRIKRFFG